MTSIRHILMPHLYWRSSLLIILNVVCLLPCFAQDGTYSRVLVQLPLPELSRLIKSGIEADHGVYQYNPDGYCTTVSEKDIQKMTAAHIPFTVLVADEVAEFIRTNKPADFFLHDQSTPTIVNFSNPCQPNGNTILTPGAFTPGSMGGYYTLAEMIAKINTMASSYPGLVKLDTIGYSIENRPLLLVKISDNAVTDEAEPEVLYTGLHHSREPMSMMNLLFFMQYLLQNYGADTRINELVNNRELFFIPCLNPDGYNYNQQTNPGGGGMHRKNRRPNGGNPLGVDLNRNYGFGWGFDNTGSSPNISAETYRGTGPFSEPEMQAIRSFINSRQFSIVLNYHAYGNYFIRPYDVAPAGGLTTEELAAYNRMGNLMTRHNCYVYGDDLATIGYITNGVAEDWLMAGDLNIRSKVYGFTPEIGSGTFWPAASQIIPLAKQNIFANVQLANLAGTAVELDDRSGTGINTLTGSFPFTVQRIGLKDGPLTVSLIPLQNIQSAGNPVTFSNIGSYGSSVSGSISYTLAAGIVSGQSIKFVWKTETGGVIQYDTITKLYNPVIVFADDMETGSVTTKWRTTGSWNYTTAAAFGGSRSVSESPAGNYTSSASSTLTLANAVNLGDATSAWLSYRIRYQAENCQDKLRVQLSTNGVGTGASFGVNLCGRNMVTESIGTLGGIPSVTGIRPEWTQEYISLNNYIGQSNVGIRFQFTSNGTNVNDGFTIDDVTILKTTAAVTLPVHFISSSAQWNNNHTNIYWSATTSNVLRYFEIEKSYDQQNWFRIGLQSPGNSPYQFADYDYQSTVMYYRIKASGINGSTAYSPVMRVYSPAQTNTITVINPFTNIIKVQTVGGTPLPAARVVLSDYTGHVLRSISIAAGTGQVSITTNELSTGTYLLQFYNQHNEPVYVQRITKLKSQ